MCIRTTCCSGNLVHVYYTLVRYTSLSEVVIVTTMHLLCMINWPILTTSVKNVWRCRDSRTTKFKVYNPILHTFPRYAGGCILNCLCHLFCYPYISNVFCTCLPHTFVAAYLITFTPHTVHNFEFKGQSCSRRMRTNEEMALQMKP